VSSSSRQKPFLTTYRPRLLADGTGWPCSRSRLISLCIRLSPPSPKSEIAFLVSLSCCVHPSQVFSIAFFFLQSHDPSFVLYHSQIVVTEFSCSQSRPVPVPGPVQTKSSLPSRAKQKKVVTCGPLFFPLACGIGIRLTNVPSSAEQKGCMGLTLSRNGFGRRGETLSRIPDTWKMYGGWPPSSLTHGKTERDAV